MIINNVILSFLHRKKRDDTFREADTGLGVAFGGDKVPEMPPLTEKGKNVTPDQKNDKVNGWDSGYRRGSNEKSGEDSDDDSDDDSDENPSFGSKNGHGEEYGLGNGIDELEENRKDLFDLNDDAMVMSMGEERIYLITIAIVVRATIE